MTNRLNVGHSNTSTPLEKIYERLEIVEAQKGPDITVRPEKLYFDVEATNGDGDVVPYVVSVDGVLHSLTQHSRGQMYRRLGSPATGGVMKCMPSTYLENISPSLWSTNMMEAQKNMGAHHRSWFLRTTDEGIEKIPQIRAALANYQPYDARDVVDLAVAYYNAWSTTGAPVHFRSVQIGRDYTRIDVMTPRDYWPTEPGVDKGRYAGWDVGISIASGEIGNASIKGGPSAYRGGPNGCDNTYLPLDGWLIARHSLSASTVSAVISDAARGIFSAFSGMMTALEEAATIKVMDMGALVRGFCLQHGLPKQVADNALAGVEENTMRGLVNGITHAAKFEEGEMPAYMQERVMGTIMSARENRGTITTIRESKPLPFDEIQRTAKFYVKMGEGVMLSDKSPEFTEGNDVEE